MTILHATQRALGEAFPSMKPGVETDKYGFPVRIDTPHEDWKDVLEELMPMFERAGWLDGMKSMRIGRNAVINRNIGNYTDGAICIEYKAGNKIQPAQFVVESSKRFVLAHEMMHHAHLHTVGYDNNELNPSEEAQDMLTHHVSQYSATNKLEAVAEIGAGVIRGYEFPEEIHDLYDEYEGPEGAYEIREWLK